jgi:hypothetical protein
MLREARELKEMISDDDDDGDKSTMDRFVEAATPAVQAIASRFIGGEGVAAQVAESGHTYCPAGHAPQASGVSAHAPLAQRE